MEIKFDVYFKKNLGTLFKDNEVDLNGKNAYTNLQLVLVDRLVVNYIVNGTKYTDDVLIKDVDENLIQIPFKSDVVKKGLNEFEIVAYMKNGDIKTSQTYTYYIDESIGGGNQASNGNNSSSDGHTHTNLNVLNSITQTRINEWDNKADLSHIHSDYYTKAETDNKISEEIAKAQLSKEGVEIDLSAYATKDYVNEKIDVLNTISIEELNDYTIFEPPSVDNSYITDTTGKILNISYEQFLNLFYDNLVGTYDDGMVVTKSILGKDESNTYNIYEYDFKPKHYTKTILLSSGMHTYELSASFGCAHFIKNMMDRNNNHNGYKFIRENVRIKVIPVINPWGWNQNPKKYGNVNGVNINRNFDYNNKWHDFPVYSSNPNDDNYNEWNLKGSSPFSEAETKILRDWGIKNKNAKFWIDCHTGLDMGPYDNFIYYLSDCSLRPKIETALSKLEDRIREKYKKNNPVTQVVIDSDGSIRQQYSNKVLGIPTFTLEQTPNNKLWGTDLNNEGGDIENYEVCLSTYVMEFLKSENLTYSLHDYIKHLEQRIIELEDNNSSSINPPSNDDNDNGSDDDNDNDSDDDIELTESLIASVDLSNGNVIDSSKNGNNAILTGTYSFDNTGINFNGEDGMIDTGVQISTNNDEFTIKYVVSVKEPVDTTTRYFFSQGVTSSKFLFAHMSFLGGVTNYHCAKLASNGNLYFETGNSPDSSPKFDIIYNSKNIFHVTCHRQDSNSIYKFYVNGNLVSVNTVNTVAHSDENLVFANTTNKNRGFVGKFYGYKIYNKCLSKEQIVIDQ